MTYGTIRPTETWSFYSGPTTPHLNQRPIVRSEMWNDTAPCIVRGGARVPCQICLPTGTPHKQDFSEGTKDETKETRGELGLSKDEQN